MTLSFDHRMIRVAQKKRSTERIEYKLLSLNYKVLTTTNLGPDLHVGGPGLTI